MLVKLKPKGVLRRYVAEQNIEITPGLTMRTLINNLNIPTNFRVTSFVNNKRSNPDLTLNDGDEIKLLTMIGGG
ncbi:MAG: hypothetical protein DDT32_01146 [Syntrophomonadaceae bacterium]|nr:hypothetical protein [Bacillota bacterium]MBT9147391.1 hypothetical protein [Bacillota bacterium]